MKSKCLVSDVLPSARCRGVGYYDQYILRLLNFTWGERLYSKDIKTIFNNIKLHYFEIYQYNYYFNLFLPGELGPVGEVVGHVYRSHQLGVVVIEVVRTGEAELSSLHVGTPG